MPDSSGTSALHLAELAAQRENLPGVWRPRFEGLMQKGLLRLSLPPGHETSLHIRRFPFGENLDRVVSFCSERLADARHKGYRLGIDLSQARPAADGNWVRQLQTKLAGGASNDSGCNISNKLFFSVLDDHPDLESILGLRCSRRLGYPTIAVRYRSGVSDSADNADRWRMLVGTSHADCRIKLIPRMAMRPLSGLQTLEKGDCVMPLSLFEVGNDTAWLILEIDAVRLAESTHPRAKLSASLRFADNLIDAIHWPRPALHVDALLNRRVGFHLTGLGDLLSKRVMNPVQVDTFRWLKRWLGFVRHCLMHESRLLARRRGPFPQLGANELIAELTPRYGLHNAKRLLNNSCLRHRHILALSPFALFPARPGSYPDKHWLNLIPVLNCADALTMYGPDPRSRLSRRDWHRLLQLTGALGAGKTVVTEGQ
jgi:hypothetical protein